MSIMKLVDKIYAFFQYWYFRYLLVTELYMVEKWERNFVNIFLISLFLLFFYFNYKIVLPATTALLVEN